MLFRCLIAFMFVVLGPGETFRRLRELTVMGTRCYGGVHGCANGFLFS
jgi:hypothetical protein